MVAIMNGRCWMFLVFVPCSACRIDLPILSYNQIKTLINDRVIKAGSIHVCSQKIDHEANTIEMSEVGYLFPGNLQA